MRIGEVASQARVRVVTLRFYEAEGLLPAVRRTANNYRAFSPETVTRVRFIRRAQELGFTLAEIRGFLRASDTRAPANAKVASAALVKLAELGRRIDDLRRMQRAIRRVLAKGVQDGPCPILQSLGG